MKMSSDEHLDTALSEYNAKIAKLEDSGPVSDLLEALINRGSIFLMMESSISALSDFDEAIDIIEDEILSGNDVDTGLYVRAFEGRGRILCGGEPARMAEDYRRIAERLGDLNIHTRYFDLKSIVQLCCGCADDLIESGLHAQAEPFIHKALDVLGSRMGDWEDNRRSDCHALLGEIYEEAGKVSDAIREYGRAIDIESYLSERNLIEDRMHLVSDLTARADMKSKAGDSSGSISDMVRATDVLEGMLSTGQCHDPKIMVDLCQTIASQYMEQGNVQESERFLLKAVKHGLPNVEDAMNRLGIKHSE